MMTNKMTQSTKETIAVATTPAAEIGAMKEALLLEIIAPRGISVAAMEVSPADGGTTTRMAAAEAIPLMDLGNPAKPS